MEETREPNNPTPIQSAEIRERKRGSESKALQNNQQWLQSPPSPTSTLLTLNFPLHQTSPAISLSFQKASLSPSSTALTSPQLPPSNSPPPASPDPPSPPLYKAASPNQACVGDSGSGGNNNDSDGNGDDQDRNKAEALAAMAEAGRSLESLPKDLAAAIEAGLVLGLIVKRFFQLKKSAVFRWLLGFDGFKEQLLADDLFLTKVGIECGVGIFTKTAAKLERRRKCSGVRTCHCTIISYSQS
ncbi:protein RETICULATA-RELATED 4, chloroplastic-like [Malus sylvestris]|uniref:protein RETICULATA-RELATED 4, chloroplastic-like n=1 Tax=Malus sylvestris TaxID=3752 RepID=UPI0021ACB018|nr:protein RETICULATA-RELATED 4, chloroplastic-like [Malus sylvestris]